MVVSAIYFDLWDYLTVEQMTIYNERLGLWAPLVFVLAFVVGEVLQIPSILWIFCAGLIWPTWLALPVSLVGAILGATSAFLVARYFLGDQIQTKLPRRFQRLNRRISRAPVRVVIMVRLTTFLHPLTHWALAASTVTLPVFIFGTFVGIIPITLALVLVGQNFLDWWTLYSGYMIASMALSVAGYLFVSGRKKRRNNNRVHGNESKYSKPESHH